MKLLASQAEDRERNCGYPDIGYNEESLRSLRRRAAMRTSLLSQPTMTRKRDAADEQHLLLARAEPS